MYYIDKIGEYHHAYAEVLANGGQLYPGNGKDSANVIVRGKQCITYWAKGSKRRQEVSDLCNYFHIPSEGKTGGRVARWLISDCLKLPYHGTFWQKRYRNIAKMGTHWHYLHVEPRKRFFGIEVDLKSAYISSLFAGKTLLFHDSKGYIEDNHCLENLKLITPELPKWFRLQLLGCLSSWRVTFFTKDKKNPNSKELIAKRYHNIEYGAAFNAVHRAIIRNDKIMEKIHQLGGEYIKRIHTDSFFLDCDVPRSTEDLIWSYLEEKKLKWDIKGCGYSYFYDVNSGFVGKKFVGSALDVTEKMRETGIKKKRSSYDEKTMNRFGDIILNSSMPNTELVRDSENSNSTPEQLVIPNWFS